MAVKLNHLAAITVAAAGTPERVTTADIPAAIVTIQAASTNTGGIWVGDSTVDPSANIGIRITPGGSVSLSLDDISRGGEEFNMSDFYIDADTNGNVASVSYVKRR